MNNHDFYQEQRIDSVRSDVPKRNRKWRDVILTFEKKVWLKDSVKKIGVMDIVNVSNKRFIIEPGKKVRVYENRGATADNHPTYTLREQIQEDGV